ncbi:hypothetical protein EVA_14661 [gut metagenome]|uniref:Uncharacterized protein n=1 Tax=gut metagenome TaxID=749906 RepID=J9GCW5_9ZZZZ
MMAKKWPKGSCAKTAGIVAKVRPGPASGESPKAKTAGMIMRPPSNEERMASITIQVTELGRWTLLER